MKTICYIEMPCTRHVTGTVTYKVECEGTEQDVRDSFQADPTTWWDAYSYNFLEIVEEYDNESTVDSEDPPNATLSFLWPPK